MDSFCIADASPTPPSPRRLVRWTGAFGFGLAVAGVLAACSTTPLVDSFPAGDGGTTRDTSAFDGTVTPPPPQDASPASCTKYCELTLSSCTGPFAQYTDLPQCVAVCETLPAGLFGDRTGNTVGCRQTYAGNVAKTDPARYCPVAGPFGGGVCGERCDAFCAIALAICPKTPWASPPACVSACTNLSYVDAGSDSGGEGLAGPTTGDTLNCRTRRLLEALAVPEQCDELGAGGACSGPFPAPPPRDE